MGRGLVSAHRSQQETGMRIAATAAAFMFALAATAPAQDSEPYPSRPVRLIAAAAPGGNPDILARLLAQRLSNVFGKPFVVENMPGAGGVVAAKLVAAAAPDGHVLMVGDSGALAINAARAGIDLLHVPYRGGSALVNGLLTGEIQAGWSGIPNVKPLIESGQLRAFCVSVLQRSKSLPDLPTCAELGYAGFDIATMLGLQTSAGAPPQLVARLQVEIAKAMR